jgi:hypothetical protein
VMRDCEVCLKYQYVLHNNILKTNTCFLSQRHGADSVWGWRSEPSDMKCSCQCVESAFVDSWKEVVLQVCFVCKTKSSSA